MTNDKGAEQKLYELAKQYEDQYYGKSAAQSVAEHILSIRAKEIVNSYVCQNGNGIFTITEDASFDLIKKLATELSNAHAAGRAEVLAEVMPVLDYIAKTTCPLEGQQTIEIMSELANERLFDIDQARRLIEKLKT